MANQPDDTADDAEAEAKPKKSKKMLFIIGGVVLLLVALGAGFFLSGMAGSLFGGSKPAEGADKAAAAAKTEKKAPVYFDLPDLLVNLNTGSRKASFLKVTVSLEIDREEDRAALTTGQPRIIDTFQTYLRELRTDDLKGSAGLFRLREELLMRVNLAMAPIKVNDVLFREMLVQ